MHYEINVSKNGKHYFATADRSLRDEEKAKKLFEQFTQLFPIDQGYRVDVNFYQNVGRPVYFNEVKAAIDVEGTLYKYLNPNKDPEFYFLTECGNLYHKKASSPWLDITLCHGPLLHSMLGNKREFSSEAGSISISI